MAPAWWWIDHPWWRAIFASGNESISLRDSVKCRDIIESDWYLDSFKPEWRLARNQNAKGYYATTEKGFREATTGGANIIGKRADALFFDDLLDASDAYSKTVTESVNNWIDQSWSNRIADPRKSTRCGIMQRLSERDPTGHIMHKQGSEYELVFMPMEFEESRRFTSSIGWTDWRKKDGELLFPERFDTKFISAERLRLGSSGYDGQMQQRPTAATGELFKRGHLQFISRDAEITFTRIIQSWDTSVKTKERHDPSCGLQIGEFEKGYLLMDRRSGRMEYPALKEQARTWAITSPIDALVIEDKSSGQQLIQEFKTSTSLPVQEFQSTADKVVYANVCVPTWEANRIYVYDDCPWVEDFLAELCAFPNGLHDDQVDAFTHGIIWLIRQKPGQGILDYYAAQLAKDKKVKEGEDQPLAADAKLVDPYTRKNLAMDIIAANR
jgi:predicted phage terminase large subunit-like protein